LAGLTELGWRVEEVAVGGEGLWLAGQSGAPVDYPASGHQLMASVEDSSPWYQERNLLVASALSEHGLPAQLLDIGAGNGGVAAYLRARGVDAAAVEPASAAASAAARRGVPTVCGMLDDLALPDHGLEAAVLLDVIEHLERPGPLLAELRRVLRADGQLVVTVPAMPSLWSQADELAGHHRRYTRETLISELSAEGFSTIRCHYAFGSLVPAVAAARALPYRLGRRRSDRDEAVAGTRQVGGYGRLPKAVAGWVFAAERRIRRRIDPSFGTSLIAVAGPG